MPTTLNIYGELSEVSRGNGVVINAQIVRPSRRFQRRQTLWTQYSQSWADISRIMEGEARDQIQALESSGEFWVVYHRIWETCLEGEVSRIPNAQDSEPSRAQEPDLRVPTFDDLPVWGRVSNQMGDDPARWNPNFQRMMDGLNSRDNSPRMSPVAERYFMWREVE